MADFIFLAAAFLAGLHALSFARWLRFKGNNLGAVGVWVIIVVGLALPVYRLMTRL